MRIAYFSPLNPIKSGISDYSEDLLPHLGKLIDVDVFVDEFEPSNPELARRFRVYSIAEFRHRRWEYDVALYHVGNNLYHEAIYRTALRFPGVIVLHDYALGWMISTMTLARGEVAAFIREWGYQYGTEGLARARDIAEGQCEMELDEPLNGRLLDTSLGVVVHSRYVRRKVLVSHPLANVVCIPMPCVSHQRESATRAAARSELGLEKEALYVGTFGFLAPSKQIETLLDVFAGLLDQFREAQLLLVGEPFSWYEPQSLIQQRGLEDRVTITGYIPISSWYSYMAAVDLAVNLRFPTMGETSASVLRLLGEGVPTVISDVGWYAELPDDCVVKVSTGTSMRADLTQAIRGLLSDAGRRESLGQTARDYVATNHAAVDVAAQYTSYLSRVLRGVAL